MQKIIFQPPPPPLRTEIYFELDPLKEIAHRFSEEGIIFADPAVPVSKRAEIQKKLGYPLISLPLHKTREAKETLEDELFERKIGRGAMIVAVGGGVATDLIAFTASTYMRGIPLILIPTTLLGMVDAAIGGKTGIDTPYGKNLIGTFYLPKAIFIDPLFLETLPEEEMKNGLSEILKIGLVDNRLIWDKKESWKSELLFLIRASIESKLKIAELDFEEKTGLRRILNFGHTVGHALELLSNYQMAHGEAVALGCMAEAYLSSLLGYLPKEDFDLISTFYQKEGYRFPHVERERFLEALTLDKKTKKGVPRFVCIDRIGSSIPFEGEYCRSAPAREMDLLIEWMNHG